MEHNICKNEIAASTLKLPKKAVYTFGREFCWINFFWPFSLSQVMSGIVCSFCLCELPYKRGRCMMLWLARGREGSGLWWASPRWPLRNFYFVEIILVRRFILGWIPARIVRRVHARSWTNLLPRLYLNLGLRFVRQGLSRWPLFRRRLRT